MSGGGRAKRVGEREGRMEEVMERAWEILLARMVCKGTETCLELLF